jgi:hypothetical protein
MGLSLSDKWAPVHWLRHVFLIFHYESNGQSLWLFNWTLYISTTFAICLMHYLAWVSWTNLSFSVFSLLFNLMSYWEMQLVDLCVNLYLDLNQILGA